jgi:CheY-like chemotaxis protein
VQNSKPLRGVAVLFVDDDKDTCEVMAMGLVHWGASVVVAQSGAEALAALEHRRFDVIVSDLAMPGITGFDLLRIIRRLPGEREGATPAIAITAFPDKHAAAAEAGFTAFMPKPFDPEKLVATITRLARLP